MKIAYFSPLTPQRSGIADYSEELLPCLAQGAAITLFVDGFHPANQELTSQFEVCDYRRQASALKQLADFDAVVYQMGNDHRYHAGMWTAMQQKSGIVVFHDFALQDFFLGLARERRDWRLYLDEVEFCEGKKVRDLAAQALDRGATPAIANRPLEFPLNRRLANSAEAVVAHSEWARARFAKIAPAVPVKRIAMPINLPAARASRSPNDEVHIASFGLVQPGKGIEHALRALAQLKETHAFRYYLVGETNSFYDVRELIRRYDLEDRVEITGHVTLAEFKRRIEQTDIALNFRERTVGETSASLVRLMAAGVCSVVSEAGWYSELPADAAVKIPLEADTDAFFVAYLKRLIEDQELRQRIGENARAFALTEHHPKQRAADYLNFITEVIDNRPRRKVLNQISNEIAELGIKSSDDQFLRGMARELASVLPARATATTELPAGAKTVSGNGRQKSNGAAQGRLPKVEGVDFKRAAIEYPRKLDPERRHYLLTKPFYNLANKPPKHSGDGMDAETFRHFCDFANIAVALGLPAGSRILDVACGSGWLSEYFARLGYVVKGIDISSDLIEMSRDRVARIAFAVDHETPLRCTFQIHDIEQSALDEKFDAIICYDSLHHFENEEAVMRHLAAMLSIGGSLFILEGDRPPAGSPTEVELVGVMEQFGTLESPFDYGYLRGLLDRHGFAVVGDYLNVNGLFEREMVEDHRLPLATLPTNYYYLNCKKVADLAPASGVPDSRAPGVLRAGIELTGPLRDRFERGEKISFDLQIQNAGDTLWLAGRNPWTGIVMPAVRVFDEQGTLVNEFHGQPALPRAVAPGEIIRLRVDYDAPQLAGRYTLKFDLVDQHICWFEDCGSTPLIVPFKVI